MKALFLLLLVVCAQVFAGEGGSIWIGAEMPEGTSDHLSEEIEQWDGHGTVRIDRSPSMRITAEHMEKISVEFGAVGPRLGFQLTPQGVEILDKMIEQLHARSGKLALMIDHKLLFLASYAYPTEKLKSICVQPVPWEVIRQLKGRKGIEWFLPPHWERSLDLQGE